MVNNFPESLVRCAASLLSCSLTIDTSLPILMYSKAICLVLCCSHWFYNGSLLTHNLIMKIISCIWLQYLDNNAFIWSRSSVLGLLYFLPISMVQTSQKFTHTRFQSFSTQESLAHAQLQPSPVFYQRAGEQHPVKLQRTSLTLCSGVGTGIMVLAVNHAPFYSMQ